MNQMIDFALLAAEDEVADTERVPYICSNDPVEGDVICITGGLYPENFGKLLRVTNVFAMVWATPMDSEFDDENARLAYIGENAVPSMGPKGYAYSGPGMIVMIDREDISVVA